MKGLWKVLPLAVLVFHCKSMQRPALPVHAPEATATAAAVSPFFIINEEKVQTSDDAQNYCPRTCEDASAAWTGVWSQQSPFADTQGGVCECREQISSAPVPADVDTAAVDVYEMSEEEMMGTFDVEAKATADSSSATASADTDAGSKAVAKAGDSMSKAESKPDVSADVMIDQKSGQVTATARAGKAVARAKTPPQDGATTSIDKTTGTVKACAQAGEARACATSQKDPFDF